jgi:signal transduction histidine kinase/CheY-like chemotaxis protein
MVAEPVASDPRASASSQIDLLDDPSTREGMYESVRSLCAGLVFIFVGFTLYRVHEIDVPPAKLLMVLDTAVWVIAAFCLWLMHRRRLPVPLAHPLAVALGLLVAANTSATVVLQGEGSDLRYIQAVVIGGGALALSGRSLTVLLLGTALLALPAAHAVSTRDELLDFVVMQITTSFLAVALCHGRLRNQRRMVALRRRTEQTALDLREALARAEREFAEHQRTEARRSELEEQLRQAQKLEALGTLAGGIAHDMNNVLGSITAIASTTLESLPPGSGTHQELSDVLSAARRGATLTRNILSFARRGPTHTSSFRIDAAVHDLESLLQRTLPKRIQVRVECGADEVWVEGDAGQIGHLLMNLCLNSADAIEGTGSITVGTRFVELGSDVHGYGTPPGSYVEIAVTDDGRGIAPEVLPRVFEPYFSTKTQTEHSGLGLSMVYGTVQQHRGGISIKSDVGRGTTVSVVLPTRPRPSSVPKIKSARPVPVDPQRNVLLFVDDEPLLRRAGKRMAKSLGFEALTAANGREALEIHASEPSRIAAVVLDVAMPVMSGEECFKELRLRDPELPVVFASGFSKDHDIQALLLEPRTRYVSKPYERDSLAQALTAALGPARRSDRAAARKSSPPSDTRGS